MGERELDGDEHGGRQRRELDRPLAAGVEGRDEREAEREQVERRLRSGEIGYPLRVVLAPVPKREWRVPLELVDERAIPEGA